MTHQGYAAFYETGRWRVLTGCDPCWGRIRKMAETAVATAFQIFDEAIQIFRDCLSGEHFNFDKLTDIAL